MIPFIAGFIASTVFFSALAEWVRHQDDDFDAEQNYITSIDMSDPDNPRIDSVVDISNISPEDIIEGGGSE